MENKYEAPEKAVQQMTKDGLVEHTVSGSKETSLSLRPPEHKYDSYEPIDFDALFSRHEAKSRERAEGNTKEKGNKAKKDGQRKRQGKGRLSFDDETTSDKTMKSGSSGRLVSRAVNAAVDAGRGAVHGKIYQVENENNGVKAAHHAEMLVENSLISAMRKQRKRSSSNRGKRLREEPDEKALKHQPTEQSTALVSTEGNSNLSQRKAVNTPALTSGTNPQQKRYIRVEYRKTVYVRTKGGASAGGKTAKAAASKADKIKEAVANFFKNHKGLWIALAILGVLFILMMIGLGSCSSMTGGVSSSVFATSYPMEDADMIGAEERYLELEAELQEYLDTYENNHDYDEYHFDLDTIEHDPYVLISAITALHGGEWTIGNVGNTIQTLFDKQYILTENVTVETRHYTETRTGTTTYVDPDTGETITEEYEYEVEIPYDYYICTVELENFNLSHVPVYIMSEGQLSTYATACASLEMWNEKVGRWVNRGAKGIALIDDSSDFPRLKYVFDISDTHRLPYGKDPYLWQLREEDRQAVVDYLKDHYSVDARLDNLSDVLRQVALETVIDNLPDCLGNLQYAIEGSFLEDLDDLNLEVRFRELMNNSLHYTLARRCGLDVENEFDFEDFSYITEFSTPMALAQIGNAVSEAAMPILMDIGRYVRTVEVERIQTNIQNPLEQNQNVWYNNFTTVKRESEIETPIDREKGDVSNDENELYEQGELLDSERNDGRTADRSSGQVRTDAEIVSEAESEQSVSGTSSERQADGTSVGDRADSQSEDGSADRSNDENGGRDRSLESGESDVVAGSDEQHSSKSRGNRSERSDLQLNAEPDSQTLSGFLVGSDIPVPLVDEVIRMGSNCSKSVLRVAAHFMLDAGDDAEFLRSEYRYGAKGVS